MNSCTRRFPWDPGYSGKSTERSPWNVYLSKFDRKVDVLRVFWSVFRENYHKTSSWANVYTGFCVSGIYKTWRLHVRLGQQVIMFTFSKDTGDETGVRIRRMRYTPKIYPIIIQWLVTKITIGALRRSVFIVNIAILSILSNVYVPHRSYGI